MTNWRQAGIRAVLIGRDAFVREPLACLAVGQPVA
jgi:hypothetical protein